MRWAELLHLGDLSLTIPVAGAIAAWLAAARAWRAALGWSLVFGLALALVAATKIAFLGWATGLPALQFKAVSGHAAGFTAVFPTLAYLLARRLSVRAGLVAAAAGLAMGGVVAAALVHAGEHTTAEAIAGWVIGAATVLCGIHFAGDAPMPPARRAVPCAVLAFVAIAWAIGSVPVGWWMVKAALVLSGNSQPTPWDSCG
jgi:hypothetical protein